MALTSNALCTVAQLKEYLDIASSDTRQDTTLELYIEAASDAVRQYLGYDPVVADYTDEKHELDDASWVMPVNRPINTVSSITIEDSTITDYETYNNYIVFPVRYTGELTISYNAGYATVPSIMTISCIRVAAVLSEEQKRGIGVNSATNDFGGMNYYEIEMDKYLRELMGYARVA